MYIYAFAWDTLCIFFGTPYVYYLGHPMYIFWDTLWIFLGHPMYIFADDRHAGRWGMREPLSQAGIIMISARDPPNAWLTVEKSGHWDIEVFFSCPRHFYRWPLVTHSLTQRVGDVLIPESAALSLRQSEWQYNNKSNKTLTNYYKVWAINFPNSALFKARVWQA